MRVCMRVRTCVRVRGGEWCVSVWMGECVCVCVCACVCVSIRVCVRSGRLGIKLTKKVCFIIPKKDVWGLFDF